MMTSRMIATLMVTITRLIFAEMLIPRQMTPVMTSTIAAATKLWPSL